ncbi:PqqD family protein [Porphyrobacter sp. ULC335]|jgi:Coenzyme PQQ synthesis protein D (PqqD)|uniref:PqqD family protein n=1 Tax=Porphyrobacter sp. ULC335 TaxID=2854260 RepID=UPI00221FD9CA|nr:PqqD family protein [Porphyrobacter sp. ULC335]UYV15723.1 PqqD family protein [Porphyrobacter sp. ULC335]
MVGQVWTRSDDWVGSEIDDSYVMVNIDTGTYVALNPTAAAVWEVLENPADQATIERVMCESFAVSPEDCHRSVTALLGQMQDLRLVSPA